MQQILRSLTAAFLAAAFVQLSCPVQAQPVAEPPPKQIALTEKQVLAFIAAQKAIQPILEKIQGPSADELPPPIKTELEAAVKKNGFKDFNDYDEGDHQYHHGHDRHRPQHQGVHRSRYRD